MTLTTPIVSTQWLADHLDVPGLRLFDASVYLTVKPDGPGYLTESGLGRWREAHIPGSHNVYYNSLLNPADGTYVPPDQLTQRFETSRPFDRRTIVYCGGGVSAGLDAIALTMLGHQDLAIYDGSMFEWCMDPALPLVTGTEPG